MAPHAKTLAAAALLGLTSLLVACASGPGPRGASPGGPDDPAAMPCTAMGCVHGLTVELAAPGGVWPPGHYVFEVTTPAGASVCEGDLPLPACDAGPALRCSGPPMQIGESGCALPRDQHGFAGIDLPDGPAHIEVSIRMDARTLVKTALDPAYREVQPNGPTCGPTCRQASARVSW